MLAMAKYRINDCVPIQTVRVSNLACNQMYRTKNIQCMSGHTVYV